MLSPDTIISEKIPHEVNFHISRQEDQSLRITVQTVDAMNIDTHGEIGIERVNDSRMELENPEKKATETERLQWIKESLKSYSPIKANVYLDRKKRAPNEDDILICGCIRCEPELLVHYEKINKKVSYNCGERCLNRIVCYECEAGSCPCGEYCRNRSFQLQQNADVFPFPSEGKGWGLRAGSNIKAGQFILQYIGEVFNLNSEEGQIRTEAYSNSTCTYLMKISGNEVIDPTFRGNMARFMNHSCKPNCVTQKWHVLGEVCVGIFALVEIKEGEELTFDYQFDIFRTAFTRCLCGAKECKGYLGVRPQDCTFENWEEKLENMQCIICGLSTEDDEDRLLMCDGCNEGYHTFCLNPPLTAVPENAWYCPKCLSQCQDEKTEAAKDSCQKQASSSEETSWQINKRLYDLACEKIRKSQTASLEPNVLKRHTQPKKSAECKEEKYLEFERWEDDYQLSKKVVPTENNTDKLPATGYKQLSSQQQVNEVVVASDSSPTELATRKNTERELKQMTLKLFNQQLAESPELLQRIIDCTNGETAKRERNALLVNTLELEVIKRNQQILHNIGVTIFWDSIRGGSEDDGDVFRKRFELTVNGNKKQLQGFEELMRYVLKSAAKAEQAYGHITAVMQIPAIFLKRFIGGSSHHILCAFERDYRVTIQFDKHFVSDECYLITRLTEIKIKGQKESIKSCYIAISSFISKLTIVRYSYSQNELRQIFGSINSLRRTIYPAEMRIPRETVMKEFNHPFYFMKCNQKEVALIGTAEEIQHVEVVLHTLFAQNPESSCKSTFLEEHYFWPQDEKNTLINFKSEFERQCEGARLFFYKPIPPRQYTTVNVSAKAESFEKAKAFLKQKFEDCKWSNETFSEFQKNTKYQTTKYTLRCIYNTLAMGNNAVIKFWDLVTADFACFRDLPDDSKKKELKALFMRDLALQLCIIYMCDMDQKMLNESFGIRASELLREIRKKCILRERDYRGRDFSSRRKESNSRDRRSRSAERDRNFSNLRNRSPSHRSKDHNWRDNSRIQMPYEKEFQYRDDREQRWNGSRSLSKHEEGRGRDWHSHNESRRQDRSHSRDRSHHRDYDRTHHRDYDRTHHRDDDRTHHRDYYESYHREYDRSHHRDEDKSHHRDEDKSHHRDYYEGEHRSNYHSRDSYREKRSSTERYEKHEHRHKHRHHKHHSREHKHKHRKHSRERSYEFSRENRSRSHSRSRSSSLLLGTSRSNSKHHHHSRENRVRRTESYYKKRIAIALYEEEKDKNHSPRATS